MNRLPCPWAIQLTLVVALGVGCRSTRVAQPPRISPPPRCPDVARVNGIASLELRQAPPWGGGLDVQLWSGGRYELRDLGTSPDNHIRTREGCVDRAQVAALLARAFADRGRVPWGSLDDLINRAPPAVPRVPILALRCASPSPTTEAVLASGDERSAIAAAVLSLVRGDADSLASNSTGPFSDVIEEVSSDFGCAAPDGAWCSWHFRARYTGPEHEDPRGEAYQLRADGRWRCATRYYERLARGRVSPHEARALLDWLRDGPPTSIVSLPQDLRWPVLFSDGRHVVLVHSRGRAPHALPMEDALQTLERWSRIAEQLSPECVPASEPRPQ